MKTKRIANYLIFGVLSLVLTYALFLVIITWPIGEYSINKAGVFGDSFGFLTSLFSGLAFSGMIITLLIQKEQLAIQWQELKDNRIELKKSAAAQERSAQLSALSAMLNECDGQLKSVMDESSSRKFLQENTEFRHLLRDESAIAAEIEEIRVRKLHIMKNIETILASTGIHIA